MKVCFLTKIDKPGVEEAISFTEKKVEKLDIFSGDRLEVFPCEMSSHNYDIIFSYISPWIVPEKVLAQTKKWNINFHPGPPNYPGIGCFNFALYNKEKTFGCTAHLMEPKVDSGSIIGVDSFEVYPDDDVKALADRTYKNILNLYKDTLSYILKYNKVKRCNTILLK